MEQEEPDEEDADEEANDEVIQVPFFLVKNIGDFLGYCF